MLHHGMMELPTSPSALSIPGTSLLTVSLLMTVLELTFGMPMTGR